MPSPSVGSNQRGLSVSITCLSSARPICVERCRRMWLIFNYWRPHRSLCCRAPYDWGVFHFGLGRPTARSSQNLYLAACITSIDLQPKTTTVWTATPWPWRCQRRGTAGPGYNFRQLLAWLRLLLPSSCPSWPYRTSALVVLVPAKRTCLRSIIYLGLYPHTSPTVIGGDRSPLYVADRLVNEHIC
jgi:hypothetical protein